MIYIIIVGNPYRIDKQINMNMDTRLIRMEGWLWYKDDEGNFYKYPYMEEDMATMQHNVELLLRGEEPEIEIDFDFVD